MLSSKSSVGDYYRAVWRQAWGASRAFFREHALVPTLALILAFGIGAAIGASGGAITGGLVGLLASFALAALAFVRNLLIAAWTLHVRALKAREDAEVSLASYEEGAPQLSFGRAEIPETFQLIRVPREGGGPSVNLSGRIIRVPVTNAQGAGEAARVHARLRFLPDDTHSSRFRASRPTKGVPPPTPKQTLAPTGVPRVRERMCVRLAPGSTPTAVPLGVESAAVKMSASKAARGVRPSASTALDRVTGSRRVLATGGRESQRGASRDTPGTAFGVNNVSATVKAPPKRDFHGRRLPESNRRKRLCRPRIGWCLWLVRAGFRQRAPVDAPVRASERRISSHRGREVHLRALGDAGPQSSTLRPRAIHAVSRA
jgi:hypothetical protein